MRSRISRTSSVPRTSECLPCEGWTAPDGMAYRYREAERGRLRIVQTSSVGDVHVIDPATNQVVQVIDGIPKVHGVAADRALGVLRPDTWAEGEIGSGVIGAGFRRHEIMRLLSAGHPRTTTQRLPRRRRPGSST